MPNDFIHVRRPEPHVHQLIEHLERRMPISLGKRGDSDVPLFVVCARIQFIRPASWPDLVAVREHLSLLDQSRIDGGSASTPNGLLYLRSHNPRSALSPAGFGQTTIGGQIFCPTFPSAMMDGMKRPQFSLRDLMFAVMVVALAAGLVAQFRPKHPGLARMALG